MKTLITVLSIFSIVCLLAIGYFAGNHGTREHTRTLEALDMQQAQAKVQVELETLEREATIAQSWEWLESITYALSLLVMPVVGSVILYIAIDVYRKRAVVLVFPNKRGMLPMPRTALESGQLVANNYDLISQYMDIQQVKHLAKRKVPKTLHYHVENSVTSTNDGQLPASNVTPFPPVVKLSSILPQTVNLDALTLSLDETGNIVTVPSNDLVHVNFAGETGNGKTNQQRGLIAQILAGGGDVVILNPHFMPVDPKSGDDWRPIQAHPNCRVMRSYPEIGTYLEQVANVELQARMDRGYSGKPLGSEVFIAVDEMPAISDEIPEAMTHLRKILNQGRKYYLWLLMATQSNLVKDIGGSEAGRSNFGTVFWVGGDKNTSQKMLGLTSKEAREIMQDKQLGKGVAIMKTKRTPPFLARLPLVDNQSIYNLLGGSATDSHMVLGTTDSKAGTTCSSRVEPVEPVPSDGYKTAVQRVYEGAEPVPLTDDEKIEQWLEDGKSGNWIVRELGGKRLDRLAQIREVKAELEGGN